MGKADFKKINDRWCGEEEMNNRAALNKFYSEAAQEQTSTKKKIKKIKTKKANHKHDYEPILIHYEDLIFICHADRCKICGKISNVIIGECQKMEDGYWRAMETSEILEKYPDLPLIEGGKFV